ncbi:hypothetical protein C8Q79DRAFT_1005211 [Trametes meyenii]|nr:hypothetical protein C8Q79DRAFT_1005211 [Trametes meyenii]
MSIAPEPSVSRGDITIQPSYFTSSLYVNPLREDIAALIQAFLDQYEPTVRPFELFKRLWIEQGWSWLHLRIYDGRARQSFIRITERLFIESMTEAQDPLARVVALFSLYTFHNTQPSTSAPPIYSVPYIEIPIDAYQSMLALPITLKEPSHRNLKPYVVYILTNMLDAQLFHLLPDSSLNAQNPSRIPREVLLMDDQAAFEASFISARHQQEGTGSVVPKKKGRPSKRDKLRKAKEALVSLEKYVDRSYVALPEPPPAPHMAVGAANMDTEADAMHTGHTIFGQVPAISLGNYVARKSELLATVQLDTQEGSQKAALRHANEAVLSRLKQIDEMAAEKGLEVGGEGGDKTGLARVERAVEELRQAFGVGAYGGILGLLEGAGIDDSSS